MEKITPFLWFDQDAEAAANFYVSIFKNSKIKTVTHYPKEAAAVSGMPAGAVMSIAFELNGQNFSAINGGPLFKFTEAISFVINCEDQAEVDYYWEKLSEGGDPKAQQCGWLKDKFGVSWQVVPKTLGQFIGGPDQIKSGRATSAMLKMKKIDIGEIERAYNQE